MVGGAGDIRSFTFTADFLRISEVNMFLQNMGEYWMLSAVGGLGADRYAGMIISIRSVMARMPATL